MTLAFLKTYIHLCLGSSVTWIGWLQYGDPANASFSIDNQPSITVKLPNIPLVISGNVILPGPSELPEPGRILFQSPILSLDTPHTLKAILSADHRNDSRVPLSLQSIVIGNGSLPLSISNTTTQPVTSTTASDPSSTPTTRTMVAHRISRETIGLVIAGSFVGALLILGIIITMLRRRRHEPSSQLPTMQPFGAIPATYLQRVLHYPAVSGPNAKGRRTLLPPILNVTATLLPSKFRRLNPAGDVPVHPTPEPAPRMMVSVNSPDHAANSHSTQRPVATVDIQEEDSGLRMVDETAPGEQIVRFLPPAYSAD